jgi:hypothetical protein
MFQNDFGHASADVLQLEQFIQQLPMSKANSWKYLEDELFIFSRPELRKYIGANVCIH